MRLKVGDIFAYILVALLIFGSYLGLRAMASNNSNPLVIIEQDGKVIEEIDPRLFAEGEDSKTIRVENEKGGYNIVVISRDGVYIEDANCPDKLCVSSPKIDKAGQTIVCIPHGLIVRMGGNKKDLDGVDDTAS